MFIFSSAVFAQESTKKWIPIEPIKETSAASNEINKPPHLIDSKIIQNLAVMKKLLDGVSKEAQDQETAKKWYLLEPDETE